jgi:hypothetical protein
MDIRTIREHQPLHPLRITPGGRIPGDLDESLYFFLYNGFVLVKTDGPAGPEELDGLLGCDSEAFI